MDAAITSGQASVRGTRSRPRSGLRRWLPPLVAALGVVMVVVAALVGGARVAGALPGAAAPADDSAEAGFARDMATHHRQAVEMAFLILERSDDPDMHLLATDIITTQQHQIGQMYAWLALWGLPQAGVDEPMAWMGHPAGERMPGMATDAELRHLAGLRGVAADQEFLRLMIRHHQGGAPMAQAIIDRSDQEVVTRLAQAIVTSQSAEVRTMEAMLTAKGGPPAAAAPPATPDAGHEFEHPGS